MLVRTYNTDLSTGASSATLSTECHNGPDKKWSGCYARLVIASPSEVMSFHWHTYANLHVTIMLSMKVSNSHILAMYKYTWAISVPMHSIIHTYRNNNLREAFFFNIILTVVNPSSPCDYVQDEPLETRCIHFLYVLAETANLWWTSTAMAHRSGHSHNGILMMALPQ